MRNFVLDRAESLSFMHGTPDPCMMDECRESSVPEIREAVSAAWLGACRNGFQLRPPVKQLLKNGLFHGIGGIGLFPVFRRIFAGRAAIVMFHEIQRDCRSELMTGTSVELFEYSISWLQREGWAIVSLEECLEQLARNDRSRRYAVLTFDDGYRDNVSVALPILERNNAPFMVYVPTAALTRTLQSWWLGLRELIRSSDDITIDAMGIRIHCPDFRRKRLALTKVDQWVHQDYKRVVALAATLNKAGISMSALNERYFLDACALQNLARHPLASIGGHTTSHAALATLDASSARAELADNRNYLENLLQLSVRHLAYPYGTPGACGPREARLASEAGYSSAVTTRHDQLSDHELNQFALPRIGVSSSFDSETSFAARMSGVQLAAHRLLEHSRRMIGAWLGRQ
ncbi:polysaccharide deacetylase family protein [Bradyrhizobium valentinum]|uniref:polysaccharide deacetylase family protein n=1 Tax=Bradyrhizobium valentinum TaxID=1518501 RepID=UPI001FD9434E|nr:polysaccharide deacetylase family protein [Bradyrhizobium valentinum]